MAHQIARDSLVRAERTAHELVGRSFLREQDFTVLEWNYLLDLAQRLKLEHVIGMKRARLQGANIALVFEKPSTSTRCAFEVAAHHQGAQVTYVDRATSHLGTAETIKDVGRVLGRMYDGIAYRGSRHGDAEVLARRAEVPVWNALTDRWHPTQSLCDVLTMREATGKADAEIAFAYCGDARSSVANSLLVAGAMLGMDVRMVAPADAWNPPAVISTARDIAAETGARITHTDDPATGVTGVDVVYADVWAPLGSATTTWASRVAMLAPYRVDMRLLELTGNAEVRFMHPLPALHDRESALAESLGEALAQGGAASADQVDAALEVTDEVFESAHSIVFDQAENRMHTVEAVLVATLGS